MMKCSQCDRPAIRVANGHPLCVEHFTMLSSAINKQNDQLSRMINYLTAEMEAVAGLPGSLPRIQIPRPVIRQGDTNVNHINIDRSTVGAVNTGTVDNIEVALNRVSNAGASEVATALQSLTESIAGLHELDDARRQQLLEIIEVLSQQASVPAQGRLTGVIKSLLDTLSKTASTASSLGILWEKVQPVLYGFFGSP